MKNLLSEYDVIIIGSGIAGLVTALKLNQDKNVLLISKDKACNNNTNLAQGGVAVTFDSNDFDSHISDTLKTGNYYNDEDRLRSMIEDGGEIIKTLIKWGVNFDKDDQGNLLLTKEGGHSKRRIIHFKDTTGQEIVRGLLAAAKKRKNVTIMEDTFAVDLIMEGHTAIGLKILKESHLRHIYAHHIVIASGGIGELYANTTNANIATGDGLAMAYRAGADIKDMEFVQFHPTALNVPGHAHFLISEAVRGEGGILRNEKGQAFMDGYHPLKDLAPRSVVSKAIFEEAEKQGNDLIYLDVTHLGEDFLKHRFPNIYKECLKHGVDIIREYIPIVPVQHYMMGGIETDAIGRTSIERLYACGEAACTGVHGANRMASNSLLEGAVFANRVAEDINVSKKHNNLPIEDLYDLHETNLNTHVIDEKRKALQKIMSSNVFIFRNKNDLMLALKAVDDLYDTCPTKYISQKGYELKNMLTVSKLIIEAALKRDDSLGSHIIEGER